MFSARDEIIGRLEQFATRNPAAIAVTDSGRDTTYGDLRRNARDLAARLVSFPDRAVFALMLPTNADMVTAALAVIYAGRPYIPIDCRAPAARIAAMLQHAQPAAVLISSDTTKLAADAAPDMPRIAVDDGDSAAPGIVQPATTGASGIASIHYTSGSTGRPKGAIRGWSQVAAIVARLAGELGITDQDRVMIGQNCAAAVWHETMLVTLTRGAQFSIDPLGNGLAATVDRLHREGITVLRGTSTMLRTLASALPAPIATLRLVTVGSEWFFTADLALFRKSFGRDTRLISVAGTTECGWISRLEIDPAMEFDGHVLPAGYPLGDMSVSVIGSDGSAVAAGEAGQLVVGGATVSSGYWREPEVSAACFVPAPDAENIVRFHSGDIARLRHDGLLELLGRSDRMVKINGTLVSLPEIEGAMRGCPGIDDAAVVTRKNGDQVMPIGYFTTSAAEDLTALAETLRERLRHYLPATMRPGELHRLDRLPRLDSGKVDLAALDRIDREKLAPLHSAPESPSAALETVSSVNRTRVHGAVRDAWIRLAGEGSFAANSSWESAGGDSLKALELLLSIESSLKQAVAAEVFTPEITPLGLIDAVLTRLTAVSHSPAAGNMARIEPETAVAWPLPQDLRTRLLASMTGWKGERPTASRMVIGPLTNGAKPPAFWVCSAAVQSVTMSRAVGDGQPLYAFCAANNVCDYTEDEVQALALRYLAEVEEIAPDGPIFIGGYCQGGVIALAMAQHALRRKRHVPLLVLMDWVFELQPYAGRALFISQKDAAARNARRRFASPELTLRRAFADVDLVEVGNGFGVDAAALQELSVALNDGFEAALSARPSMMPAEGYRATVSADGIPPGMLPGQLCKIQVTIRNESDLVWGSTFDSGFVLGARWTDADGDLVRSATARSHLPEIAPRGIATVELTIMAPSQLGDFSLHIDLCEEGNRWFNPDPRTAFTVPVRIDREDQRSTRPQSRRYTFNVTSNALHLLTAGWSTPEGWGIWSIGPRAKLLLPLRGETGTWRVVVTAKAFGRPDERQLPVFVRVGQDGDLVKWTMPASSYVQNAIDVECTGDDVALQFSVPQAISPLELGTGKDKRVLGIALIALELGKLRELARGGVISRGRTGQPY